jgi:diaminopimelate epimerase
MLQFTKMNGAGNDFVMVDNRSGTVRLDGRQIAHLCDRHRGVGADGVLLVEAAQHGSDFRMRYYNADGGEAEMCGNGARCFARFAQRIAGLHDAISFETPAGQIRARLHGALVTLDMSRPTGLEWNAALGAAGEQLTVHSLNTGVPHAVVMVDALESVDVQRLGAALRFHTHFAPKGTNVNFVEVLGPGSIAIRTYERGVEGETLACGTGVCASAILYARLAGIEPPVSVRVRGGDTLEVSFRGEGDTFEGVTLTGPADFVFDGEIAV